MKTLLEKHPIESKDMPAKSQMSSRLSALLLYVFLVLLRAPQVVWPGRFWAEEGIIYFLEASTRTFGEVLATSNLGYYSLFNKIASITAVHVVALQFAPFITMLFALSAQVLPACLLLYSHIPSLKSRSYKVCAVFLVLLIQPNQEVWLNTVNSQFFFCISTAVILISGPTTRFTQVFRLGVLALAGLTGVVSCLLLPFFWIQYAWTRDRNKLYESVVLTCVSLIQVTVVILDPVREPHWYLNIAAFVLFTKQWVVPIFGSHVAAEFSSFARHHQLFNSTPLALLTALPYVALGFGLAHWGNRSAWLLAAASLWVAFISFLMSAVPQGVDGSLRHLSELNGGRYYYAPNVLLALALLEPLVEKRFLRQQYSRAFRAGCLALLGLMAIVGTHDFATGWQRHKWFFEGPSWPVEVRNWQENNQNELHIWPRPWILKLPKSERAIDPEK